MMVNNASYIKFIGVLFVLIIAGIFSSVYLIPHFITDKNVYASDSDCPIAPSAENQRFSGLLSTSTLSSSIYGSGHCVISNQAVIEENFYSYANLRRQFYDLVKNPSLKESTPLEHNTDLKDVNLVADKIYLVNGDMKVTGNPSGNKTGIFFVQGNLTISTSGTSFNYGQSYGDRGLVFIVKGKIDIAPAVTEINAVLVAEGYSSAYTICTNYSTGACVYPDNLDSLQLTVNGSLISLGLQKIEFKRDAQNSPDITIRGNVRPVEVVNAQPKYLVILRHLMPQNLSVVTEDTNFGL
jgi:hypothetical protein